MELIKKSFEYKYSVHFFQIRMQAQTAGFARHGMLESLLDIYRKEGIKGLWRVSENLTVLLGKEKNNT